MFYRSADGAQGLPGIKPSAASRIRSSPKAKALKRKVPRQQNGPASTGIKAEPLTAVGTRGGKANRRPKNYGRDGIRFLASHSRSIVQIQTGRTDRFWERAPTAAVVSTNRG
jgi:hypothetical protein